MPKSFFILLTFLFLLNPNKSAAQDVNIEKLLEQYLENNESTADYSQLRDELELYLQNPLHLNIVQADVIVKFPLFTQAQAIAIIEHKKKYGNLLHINELQVIGFSTDQIQVLKNFISLELNFKDNWKTFKKSLGKGNLELINTNKYNFSNEFANYLGNPFSHSLRFRYKSNQYSFSITSEKDAGELYWKQGPDFYSMHAAIKNLGAIKYLIVGDYLVHQGQGLVLGSGLGLGKSANVLSIARNRQPIREYRGLNEFLFFRGVATEMGLNKNLTLLLAAARNNLNARVALDSNRNILLAGNIDVDGLHRTNNELLNKKTVSQNLMVASLTYHKSNAKIGIASMNFMRNAINNNNQQLYNQFLYKGKNQHYLSIYGNCMIKNMYCFGEVSYLAQNNATAALLGSIVSVNKFIDFAFLYRNYPRHFAPEYSTAFGNDITNENGFYSGIVLQFHRYLKLQLYADIWKHPWLKYRIAAPSENTDLLGQLDFNPTKKSTLYIRVRNISSFNNTNSEFSKTDKIVPLTRRQIRLNINHKISEKHGIELRFENILSGLSSSLINNYLSFADYNFGFGNWGKIKCNFRYYIYRIPDYYGRIFAFENQLLYEYSIIGFYGNGQAFYFNIEIPFKKKFRLKLRHTFSKSINNSAIENVRNISGFQLIFTP